MRDDLGQKIDSGLGAENVREPDLNWVVARGRRLRTLRRAAGGMATAAVIAAGSLAILALPTDRPVPAPVVGDQTPAPVDDGATGPGMVEDMTEQEQAEVFAFRALAHTGLMNPYGARTYLWTYADDTTQTDAGWQVGFAASDCEPREGSRTCRGLSGEEDENGNALADMFLVVRVDGDRWVAVDIEGNMLPEDRARVIGYSLPKRAEPSHWDFAAVGIWPHDDEYGISMMPIWVGPYPTLAPGSACQMFYVLVSGEKRPVPQPHGRFYEDAPNRPFERGGWVLSTGFVSDEEVERGEVQCHQTPRPDSSATPQERNEPPQGPRHLIATDTFQGPQWGELEGESWWLEGWQGDGFRCWTFNLVEHHDEGRMCSFIESERERQYIGGSLATPGSQYGAERSIIAGELRPEVSYVEIELPDGVVHGVEAIVPDASLGIDARYFIAFAEPSATYWIAAYDDDGKLLERRHYDENESGTM